MSAPTNTYESSLDISLGHVPQGADDNPELYDELLDIHNAIEAMLTELNAMPKDFLIEVQKGNVPGHRLETVLAKRDVTSAVFQTLWGAPAAAMTYATVAETWVVSSTNVADTVAGTGARILVVRSLDENFTRQTTTVVMNGVTPVVLDGTHIRPRFSFIPVSGSGETNAGDITITDQATAAVRQVIKAGIGDSQDGNFTVEADHTAIALQLVPFFPKNEDGFVRVVLRIPGPNPSKVVASEFPFYQSGVAIPIKADFDLPELFDVILEVKTTNFDPVVVELDFLVVENAFVASAQAAVAASQSRWKV